MPSLGQAYEIVSVNSGKVLDVTGASQADGTPLQQWSSSGGTNQQWFLNPVGLVNWQEAYEIVSVNSGKVVDVSGASTADGAPVIQYTSHDGTNQQWFLYAVASQNRSPQLVVEKKFMQNYRVASAVN